MTSIAEPHPKYLKGWPLFLATFGVSLAAFLIVLDYTVANVSIPYISGDLAVSVDQGTYVITSFAVGNAVALPITGWLTKRVGMIRLMVLSILLFTLFSWICGASRNLMLLVVARFIQGFVAGPMIPLSQTILVTIYPPEKKTFATAFWATIIFGAPVLGPILGGWISYDYHWPWIFYLNLPFGLMSAFLIHLLLKGFETKKESPPLDWIGLILLFIGVACLQILLDKGQQWDWFRSPLVTTLAVGSVVAFSFLIPWEHFHKTPLLDLRLFKIRSYTISTIFIFFVYAIYFGGIVLVPLWLQTNMNYTSIWAGFAVAPLGIFPILFSAAIGGLVQRIGIIIPFILAFIFFALSSFISAYLDTDVTLKYIGFTRFLFGVGWAFFVVPIFILNIQDVSMQKLPSAAGMFQFIRAMSGAIGTSVFTTLWIRRSAFQHSNITTYMAIGNEPTTQIMDQFSQMGFKKDKATALLDSLAGDQAAMLALNDCFYFMGMVFIGLMFFLFFIRTKKSVLNAPLASD